MEQIYVAILEPLLESEWFIRKPIGIEALIRKVESRLELQLKHNIDQTDIYP
jgi:hypothetical protein